MTASIATITEWSTSFHKIYRWRRWRAQSELRLSFYTLIRYVTRFVMGQFLILVGNHNSSCIDVYCFHDGPSFSTCHSYFDNHGIYQHVALTCQVFRFPGDSCILDGRF